MRMIFTYIDIEQVQNDGYFFEMPLELKIFYDKENLIKLETINLDKDSRRFYISSESKPKDIILDPSTKLLAKWDFKEIN